MKNESDILFIGIHPSTTTTIDGFVSRVQEIDNVFSEKTKIYLQIHYLRSFRNKEYSYSNKTTAIKLNYFIHFFKILKYLKNAKKIYIHSIFQGARIFPHFLFLKKKAKVCLELHGVFPEELKYKGEKLTPIIYNWIEKHIVNFSDILVFVSKKFENYFLQKYPGTKSKIRLVIPTCNFSIFQIDPTPKVESIKKKYNINENDLVFIYSGSTEIWQKIELTLETISNLFAKKDNIKFFILTLKPEEMINLVEKYKLPLGNKIFILKLGHEELPPFYQISHFGFVLRDDTIVNRVAFPTKLLEYLYFGIIPIMKSTNIGDIDDYECDYIKLEDIDKIDGPLKSEKNKRIARTIAENYLKELERLKSIFLGNE